MTRKTITPVAAIVGAALMGGLGSAQAALTDVPDEPLFSAVEIGGGTMQLAGEGSCGEGKCGGEGSCGGKDEGEGSCGEGKCGSDKG